MTYHDSESIELRLAPTIGPMPFEMATTAPCLSNQYGVQSSTGLDGSYQYALIFPSSGAQPLARKLSELEGILTTNLSRKVTTSDTIVCARVIRPPPPNPVKARNAIICVAVCASEAARDPTKKTKMQLSSTVFREKISDRRPYTSWKDVDVLPRLV